MPPDETEQSQGRYKEDSAADNRCEASKKLALMWAGVSGFRAKYLHR